MADRWLIEERSDSTVEVQRNGAWYSDEDTVDDAVALLRNRRARGVEIVWADGYREQRRL